MPFKEVKYADFFAPPSKPPSGAAKRAQAKALKTAGGAKGKGKAAARRRDEDEMDLDEDEMMEVSDEEDEEHGDEQEDDEEEEDDDEDDEEEGDEEMDDEEEEEAFGARKGKTDLFADDDEAEETDAGTSSSVRTPRGVHSQSDLLRPILLALSSAPQSTHAKRLAALNAQIASLEAENAGPKQWALAGEASSRARPLNAVLEEDLEFDTVGKQVPLVTEEKVKNLEEKIKQRILEVCLLPISQARAREDVLACRD
jgi:U3 small nucleolar RNA-associated protein MPP10